MDSLCPSVFKLADGRYVVRGLEVWPQEIVGKSERMVIVDPEMIIAAVAEQKAE